jgi:hypothetical protein
MQSKTLRGFAGVREHGNDAELFFFDSVCPRMEKSSEVYKQETY